MIREFFYVDSQGQQVGPVLFEDLKKLPLTSSTLVWFPGQAEWKRVQEVPEFLEALYGSFTPPPVPPQAKPYSVPDNDGGASPGGDDTIFLNDSEETKFVFPGQKTSLKSEARPTTPNVHNPAFSADNGPSMKTLILILFGAAIVLTGIFWLMIPRTACVFNTTPLITSIVFGSLILIGAVFVAAYTKAKSAKIALIIAGLLIGGGQVLVTYGHFGDYGDYERGFLICNQGVFDKWGNEILPRSSDSYYRIDGEKGARFMTCRVQYEPNAKIVINAYDEEGDRVIHGSIDLPDDFNQFEYEKREEYKELLIKYLEEKYKIVIEDQFNPFGY